MYSIWKYSATTLLILLTLAGPSSAAAIEKTPIRNPDLLAFGGTEIEIHPAGTAHRFVLFAAPGVALGEGTLSHPDSTRLRIDYTDSSGVPYALTWSEDHGQIVLLSPDGRTGTSRFDLQSRRWTPDPTFEQLMAEDESTFVAMAALGSTVQEMVRGRGLRVGKSATSRGSCSSATDDVVAKNLGTGVTCAWTPSCRGFATSLSRSYCCFEAESDANHCCTNTWCYGCCDLLACDASCGLGDYGCFCGMSGFECVGPRFE